MEYKCPEPEVEGSLYSIIPWLPCLCHSFVLLSQKFSLISMTSELFCGTKMDILNLLLKKLLLLFVVEYIIHVTSFHYNYGKFLPKNVKNKAPHNKAYYKHCAIR